MLSILQTTAIQQQQANKLDHSVRMRRLWPQCEMTPSWSGRFAHIRRNEK